jgi:hypothetical protein
MIGGEYNSSVGFLKFVAYILSKNTMFMKSFFTVMAACYFLSVAAQSTFQAYWEIPDSNQFTEIGKVFNQISTPVDLAFHPDHINRPFELWVLNQGTSNSGGHTVLIENADGENYTHQMIKDGNAWHFMAMASAMDFGDNGNWATSQDIKDANRQGGTFTGPTLWSSDLSVYGVIGNPPNAQYNGSHLDMVHQTPYGKGIAHEKDNVYWVFDGWSSTLTRYDFVDDHGPGQHYHGDAVLYVYNEISVQPEGSLPSHVVMDKSTNYLYVCHTSAGEIIRVDVTSGTRGGALFQVTPGEALADYAYFKDVGFETMVSTGLQKPVGCDITDEGILVVTDNATGEIIFYDTEDPNFAELGRMQVGYSNPDLMGVTVGMDNKIYFADYDNQKVVRIDNSMVYPVGIETQPAVSFSIAPNPTQNGQARIQLEREMQAGAIIVRDITGRLIQHIDVHGADQATIDLSGMTRGTYLVEVQEADSGTSLGTRMLVH